MLNKFIPLIQKPAPYEQGTSALWNDEHISKQMLRAHLDPEQDGATRNADFVNQSVSWITDMFPSKKYPQLLDLGCGPGVYAEKFHKKNYQVTGVDFSQRSIQYAQENAKEKGLNIRYINQDYLTLSYEQEFHIAAMIYCDFGVLSDQARKTLLTKIYTALKPHGAIIFDVFTPDFYKDRIESKRWEYCDTGFFSGKPYINMESFYRYDDCNTFLDQHIIITDDDMKCYNIWNHGFTAVELRSDLEEAGFCGIELFGDISGAPYSEGSHTICVTARKASV